VPGKEEKDLTLKGKCQRQQQCSSKMRLTAEWCAELKKREVNKVPEEKELALCGNFSPTTQQSLCNYNAMQIAIRARIRRIN